MPLQISLHRYRFAEICYHRPAEVHKGRQVAARNETVVIFLPDVWSCSPSRLEWENMQAAYKKALETRLSSVDPDCSKEEAQALLRFLLLPFFRIMHSSSPPLSSPPPPPPHSLYIYLFYYHTDEGLFLFFLNVCIHILVPSPNIHIQSNHYDPSTLSTAPYVKYGEKWTCTLITIFINLIT